MLPYPFAAVVAHPPYQACLCNLQPPYQSRSDAILLPQAAAVERHEAEQAALGKGRRKRKQVGRELGQ
jgi:hypothetical protein